MIFFKNDIILGFLYTARISQKIEQVLQITSVKHVKTYKTGYPVNPCKLLFLLVFVISSCFLLKCTTTNYTYKTVINLASLDISACQKFY